MNNGMVLHNSTLHCVLTAAVSNFGASQGVDGNSRLSNVTAVFFMICLSIENVLLFFGLVIFTVAIIIMGCQK